MNATLSPAPAVATSNACLSSGFKIGAGESLLFLAASLEAAKIAAEEAFCRYRAADHSPRLLVRYVRTLRRCERLRLLVRYVRTLRRCERLRASLARAVADESPAPIIDPKPEDA